MREVFLILALFFLLILGGCAYVFGYAATTAVNVYEELETRPERSSEIVANSLNRNQAGQRSPTTAAPWLIVIFLGGLAFLYMRSDYFRARAEDRKQKRLTDKNRRSAPRLNRTNQADRVPIIRPYDGD